MAAAFESVPNALPPQPAPPPPPPSAAGPGAAHRNDSFASAASFAQLAAALADPSVSRVALTASFPIPRALALSGPGRAVTVSGACRPAPPAHPLAPAGLCALDARGASRHFTVEAGASLALENLALLNGAALQGAAVLSRGARVAATNCLFSGGRALGDGGAVLGIRSAVTLSNCAPLSLCLCRFLRRLPSHAPQ